MQQGDGYGDHHGGRSWEKMEKPGLRTERLGLKWISMEQKGLVKGFGEKKPGVTSLLNIVESALCPPQQIGYTDDITYSKHKS